MKMNIKLIEMPKPKLGLIVPLDPRGFSMTEGCIYCIDPQKAWSETDGGILVPDNVYNSLAEKSSIGFLGYLSRAAMVMVSIGTALFGTGCVSTPGLSEELQYKTIDIDLGYNALETAATNDGNIRNRLYHDFVLKAGPVKAESWGLNEVDNGDIDTYFGRNVLTLGPRDWNTSLATVLKTDSDGVFDTKVGIRDKVLVDILGGYGYIDLTADDEAANLTLFYGRGLGKGFSAEMFQIMEYPFQGHVSDVKDLKPYTELQLNKSLGKHVSLFGRAEIANFRFDRTTRYMVGITVR